MNFANETQQSKIKAQNSETRYTHHSYNIEGNANPVFPQIPFILSQMKTCDATVDSPAQETNKVRMGVNSVDLDKLHDVFTHEALSSQRDASSPFYLVAIEIDQDKGSPQRQLSFTSIYSSQNIANWMDQRLKKINEESRHLQIEKPCFINDPLKAAPIQRVTVFVLDPQSTLSRQLITYEMDSVISGDDDLRFQLHKTLHADPGFTGITSEAKAVDNEALIEPRLSIASQLSMLIVS